MKKSLVVLYIILLSAASVYGQSGNYSDGTIPPGVPPPPINLKNCYGVPYNINTHKCDCICGIIPLAKICTKSPDVKIHFPKQICIGAVDYVTCTPSPSTITSSNPGTYLVTTDNHFMRLTTPTVMPAELRADKLGWGVITVKYTACGESVIKDCHTLVLDSPNVTVAIDTIAVCPGRAETAEASGLPAGGTYSWSGGDGITILGPSNKSKVAFRSDGGNSNITVTYTSCKKSDKKAIQIIEPTVVLDVPDAIDVFPDTVITINPRPEGLTHVKWKVSNGLKIISQNRDAVTIKVLNQEQPTVRTATLKGRMCNRDTSTTVTINVNTCQIKFIDITKQPVEIREGDVRYITAIGNRGIGQYEWTILSGNMAIVNMTQNNAVVQIKGMVAGPGKAQIEFTSTDCSLKKVLDIIVLTK